MWYDKLSKTLNKDYTLKGIDVASRSSAGGLCIALKRMPNAPTKFSLTSLNCNEQRFAICRLKTPMVPAAKKPPKFPCVSESNNPRRKRSNDNSAFNEIGSALCLHAIYYLYYIINFHERPNNNVDNIFPLF